MKRSIQATVTALLAGSLLAACGGSSSTDQVHTTFRTSFMTACTKQPGFDKYCGCVADAIIAKYPDDQALAGLDGKPDEMKSAVDEASAACKSMLPGQSGSGAGPSGSSGAAAPSPAGT